jgi:hypothetical protein
MRCLHPPGHGRPAAATAEVIQGVSAGRTGTGWTPACPASSRPGVAGGARGGTDHAARRGTGEAPRSCMPAPGASPTRARPARPASRALALFSTEKQCRCPLFRRGCVMSLEGCCTWQPPAPMLPADPRYPCSCVASSALCHKCTFPHACVISARWRAVSLRSEECSGGDQPMSRREDKLYASALDGIEG